MKERAAPLEKEILLTIVAKQDRNASSHSRHLRRTAYVEASREVVTAVIQNTAEGLRTAARFLVVPGMNPDKFPPAVNELSNMVRGLGAVSETLVEALDELQKLATQHDKEEREEPTVAPQVRVPTEKEIIAFLKKLNEVAGMIQNPNKTYGLPIGNRTYLNALMTHTEDFFKDPQKFLREDPLIIPAGSVADLDEKG